jgi:hypothetical protein
MSDELERISKVADVTEMMGVALTLEMLCSNLGRALAALTFVGLLKNDGKISALGHISFQIISRSLFINCSVRRFLVRH